MSQPKSTLWKPVPCLVIWEWKLQVCHCRGKVRARERFASVHLFLLCSNEADERYWTIEIEPILLTLIKNIKCRWLPQAYRTFLISLLIKTSSIWFFPSSMFYYLPFIVRSEHFCFSSRSPPVSSNRITFLTVVCLRCYIFPFLQLLLYYSRHIHFPFSEHLLGVDNLRILLVLIAARHTIDVFVCVHLYSYTTWPTTKRVTNTKSES